MTEARLITGVVLVACLAGQVGCAPVPPPVTRTVSTEQVTTTAPPPPPPILSTTTTENVMTPTVHRRWSPADADVEEESTETIVPSVTAPRQTMTRTTTRSTTGY
jgi:hypothetical protein